LAVMSLELILVRHGETEWNKEGFFRGHEDMGLNATGIAQADAASEALKDKVFEAIYSSTLKRALVTARRIAIPHEIAVREKAEFLDINFGVWQGKKEDAVKALHPKLYERWNTNPWGVKFPAGDRVKKSWRRVISGLREVLFTHGTGCVVVVSHRIPIKFMTGYLLKMPRKEFYKVVHDPGAISIFEVTDKSSARPIVLNDTRHLAKLSLGKQRDF